MLYKAVDDYNKVESEYIGTPFERGLGISR